MFVLPERPKIRFIEAGYKSFCGFSVWHTNVGFKQAVHWFVTPAAFYSFQIPKILPSTYLRGLDFEHIPNISTKWAWACLVTKMFMGLNLVQFNLHSSHILSSKCWLNYLLWNQKVSKCAATALFSRHFEKQIKALRVFSYLRL